MSCRLQVRPYGRRLRRPLTTRYGTWRVRRGILVRLEIGGRVGFGDIAPIPWFGTETWAMAWEFCQGLGPQLQPEALLSVPSHLPACQFGLESALADGWQRLQSHPVDSAMIAGLLPAGPIYHEHWNSLWQQGHRCFKWKIGVYPWQQEWAWLQAWLTTLPPEARLRLDANGGLVEATARRWLQGCDRINAIASQIEFLEQPLPPTQLPRLRCLSQEYQTPIALDESVATVQQLAQVLQQGWPGIVVLKPAIAGSLQSLRQICQHWSLDCVISSALETPIGQRAVLSLLPELGTTRALGWGVNHWFDDGWEHLSDEHLWQRVSQDAAAVLATRGHG